MVATSKLSAIAPAARSPILGDLLVGVAAGNVDQLLQPGRQVMTTDLTLWVDPVGGSNSNNGLTSGTAFLTAQHAWDVAADQYDGGGHFVVIKLVPGSYVADNVVTGYLIQFSETVGFVGADIRSSTLNAADVTIDVPSGTFGAFGNFGPCCDATVRNVTCTNSALSGATYADIEGPMKFQWQTCTFGPTGTNGTLAYASGRGAEANLNQCTIAAGGAGTIGNAAYASQTAECIVNTCTITGALTVAHGMMGGDNDALVISDNSWTGSATGPRFQLFTGAVVNCFAGSLFSIPGDSIGTIENTCQVYHVPRSGYGSRLYPGWAPAAVHAGFGGL